MRYLKIVMMMTLAVMLPAAGAMRAGAEDGRAGDHAALRALMAEAVRAINDQDMAALGACFAREFVFTTVDQQVLTSTQALGSYYDRMLRGKDSPVSGFRMAPRVELPTVFTGADAGYSCGVSDDAYTLRRNGRVIHIASRWTAAVVRENGAWKLAAVHAGVDFTDNPLLRIRSMPWWRHWLRAVGIGNYPGER